MLNDTIPGTGGYWDWYWDSFNKPILTGNSNGWKSFWVNLAVLGKTYNINYEDTVLYRFSFISDSIQTNKCGLMFDDFLFVDLVESGIKEQGYDYLRSTCFPNPVANQLTIIFNNINNSIFEFEIYDASGKQITHLSDIKSQEFNLDTKDFKKGVFYYRLIDKNCKKISTGSFIKNQ
jgi:hypothetical protein